jgi:hypothetical protein
MGCPAEAVFDALRRAPYLLLNIVSQPSEEYFFCGSRQTNNFDWLKKLCYAGWRTVSTCMRVWIGPYTVEKRALLLVLNKQVHSKKKVRMSPCAGVLEAFKASYGTP